MELHDLPVFFPGVSLRLKKASLSSNPLKQLVIWLQENAALCPIYPTAMTLSTASMDGKVSSRQVLLKGLDKRGLIFYTNYRSRKGCQLGKNPYAAINFFFKETNRQVSIEGRVKKLPSKESDAYFISRPLESQIAAALSPQSQPIHSIKNLEKACKKSIQTPISRPAHWGGYILVPSYFEFWQGGDYRLHDRFAYTKISSKWNIERLAP